MTAKPQYQNIPITQTTVTYKKKAIVTSKKKKRSWCSSLLLSPIYVSAPHTTGAFFKSSYMYYLNHHRISSITSTSIVTKSIKQYQRYKKDLSTSSQIFEDYINTENINIQISRLQRNLLVMNHQSLYIISKENSK